MAGHGPGSSAPRRRAVAALALAVAGLPVAAGAPAVAAPPGDDAVVAFVVNGVGNGHGRGLSQWGSYGRALAGQDYREILAAYYGGTAPGTRAGAGVRVRLTGWDNASTVGVISASGAARLNDGPTGYASLRAVETSPNTFDVYGSPNLACPEPLVVPMSYYERGASGDRVRQLQQVLAHFEHDPGAIDGIFGAQTESAVLAFQSAQGLPQTGAWDQPTWTRAQALLDAEGGGIAWGLPIATVTGPVRFTTTIADNADPGAVLGLCTAAGGIVHYRGNVELHDTPSGNRVVNAVAVDAYLRGVVPRESPASWGSGGNGAGMNALKAQAVAARSYAVRENRGGYNGYHGVASTCDTSSCQVYGGAATRQSPKSGVRPLEAANTDVAVAQTAGEVRVWPSGDVALTEFSASNGPYTAGGAFPSVEDEVYDDQVGNPLHRWTRVIDADRLAEVYGLSRADALRTTADGGSPYDGIWANHVTLGDGRTVSAWDFRNAFGLPAPGFELIPITRTTASASTFAYIGDSVGVGIAGEDASPLRVLLEGVHADQFWNSRGGRPTGGGGDDGVAAATTVPIGTDLVVVELGYNDTPTQMPARIDAVMQRLRERGVGQVLWSTVSERRTSVDYARTNAALWAAAGRWPELTILDWKGASEHPAATRWYTSDGVHLTTTGNAEFSLFLRSHILGGTARPVGAGSVYRVPVLGLGGLPSGATAGEAGLAGVALNVTAVNPAAPGWLRVWDCAAPEPDTSSVNFMSAGATEPNAVVVPLGAGSSEVCVRAKERTHVIVDVAGAFPADASGTGVLQPAAGRVIDTRETARVPAQGVLRVPVLGQVGLPASGVGGVALNVTAVNPVAPGWLRVWDCAAPEPGTSSVNYMRRGAVEPNAVIVPFFDGTGEVCVRSLVESDVIVDVAGWFSGGVRSAAGRAVDTRESAPVPGKGVLRVPVLGVHGVPAGGVVGVALNVTAVGTSAPGWLRVWDCAAAEPDTSSVNYLAGATEPNAVIVPFGSGSSGEVCVKSLVETNVIVDIAGWFESGVSPAAGRIADTRYGIGPLPD